MTARATPLASGELVFSASINGVSTLAAYNPVNLSRIPNSPV
jgi:hypothetical protein